MRCEAVPYRQDKKTQTMRQWLPGVIVRPENTVVSGKPRRIAARVP